MSDIQYSPMNAIEVFKILCVKAIYSRSCGTPKKCVQDSAVRCMFQIRQQLSLESQLFMLTTLIGVVKVGRYIILHRSIFFVTIVCCPKTSVLANQSSPTLTTPKYKYIVQNYYLMRVYLRHVFCVKKMKT